MMGKDVLSKHIISACVNIGLPGHGVNVGCDMILHLF